MKKPSFRVVTRLPQKTSLVAQAAAAILEEIETGRWIGSLPGEHDLRAQLHVSRRTVRAALKQLARRGAIKCRHGRRREIVNQGARMKLTSSRVLILMPEPLPASSPLAVFLIDTLREHLMQAGYVLETHASRVPFRARTPRELESLAKTLHPAGWVLLGSTESMQRWFATQGLPCVVVGSRYEGIALPSVDRDFGAVCQHAVNQIVARGHKRLVLLSPRPASAGDVITAVRFREAVNKVGGLEGTIQEHDGSVVNICALVDKLMSRAQSPTAFLVCRAHHVLTVMGHLLSTGVKIPNDVAVISRDDDSFLQDVVPTVARYSHNQNAFASKVSHVVMEMVRGQLRTQDYRIMPLYIPGNTLG